MKGNAHKYKHISSVYLHVLTVHQTFKHSMKGNTHEKDHISSVYAARTAWHRRIIQHFECIHREDKNDDFIPLRSLSVFFLGGEGLKRRECEEKRG